MPKSEIDYARLLEEVLILAGISPEEAGPKFFGYNGRQIRRWIAGEIEIREKQKQIIEQGIKKIQSCLGDFLEESGEAVWANEIAAKLFTEKELSEIDAAREKKRETEQKEQEKIGGFLLEVMKKADKSERQDFMKPAMMIHFTNILRLAKKYGVELPQ
jgi:hypothetical protein